MFGSTSLASTGTTTRSDEFRNTEDVWGLSSARNQPPDSLAAEDVWELPSAKSQPSIFDGIVPEPIDAKLQQDRQKLLDSYGCYVERLQQFGSNNVNFEALYYVLETPCENYDQNQFNNEIAKAKIDSETESKILSEIENLRVTISTLKGPFQVAYRSAIDRFNEAWSNLIHLVNEWVDIDHQRQGIFDLAYFLKHAATFKLNNITLEAIEYLQNTKDENFNQNDFDRTMENANDRDQAIKMSILTEIDNMNKALKILQGNQFSLYASAIRAFLESREKFSESLRSWTPFISTSISEERCRSNFAIDTKHPLGLRENYVHKCLQECKSDQDQECLENLKTQYEHDILQFNQKSDAALQQFVAKKYGPLVGDALRVASELKQLESATTPDPENKKALQKRQLEIWTDIMREVEEWDTEQLDDFFFFTSTLEPPFQKALNEIDEFDPDFLQKLQLGTPNREFEKNKLLLLDETQKTKQDEMMAKTKELSKENYKLYTTPSANRQNTQAFISQWIALSAEKAKFQFENRPISRFLNPRMFSFGCDSLRNVDTRQKCQTEPQNSFRKFLFSALAITENMDVVDYQTKTQVLINQLKEKAEEIKSAKNDREYRIRVVGYFGIYYDLLKSKWILSQVHTNLNRLESMLQHLDKDNDDNFFFTKNLDLELEFYPQSDSKDDKYAELKILVESLKTNWETHLGIEKSKLNAIKSEMLKLHNALQTPDIDKQIYLQRSIAASFENLLVQTNYQDTLNSLYGRRLHLMKEMTQSANATPYPSINNSLSFLVPYKQGILNIDNDRYIDNFKLHAPDPKIIQDFIDFTNVVQHVQRYVPFFQSFRKDARDPNFLRFLKLVLDRDFRQIAKKNILENNDYTFYIHWENYNSVIAICLNFSYFLDMLNTPDFVGMANDCINKIQDVWIAMFHRENNPFLQDLFTQFNSCFTRELFDNFTDFLEMKKRTMFDMLREEASLQNFEKYNQDLMQYKHTVSILQRMDEWDASIDGRTLLATEKQKLEMLELIGFVGLDVVNNAKFESAKLAIEKKDDLMTMLQKLETTRSEF